MQRLRNSSTEMRRYRSRLSALWWVVNGREPAPRGPTTLVSFPSPDPPGERALLAERGVIVRNIPDRPWLRASVGAWNDEDDLDRLLVTLSR